MQACLLLVLYLLFVVLVLAADIHHRLRQATLYTFVRMWYVTCLLGRFRVPARYVHTQLAVSRLVCLGLVCTSSYTLPR